MVLVPECAHLPTIGALESRKTSAPAMVIGNLTAQPHDREVKY